MVAFSMASSCVGVYARDSAIRCPSPSPTVAYVTPSEASARVTPVRLFERSPASPHHPGPATRAAPSESAPTSFQDHRLPQSPTTDVQTQRARIQHHQPVHGHREVGINRSPHLGPYGALQRPAAYHQFSPVRPQAIAHPLG